MKQRQRGFTLLEILLVLSLMGVLMALVGGALLGANRAVLKAQRYTVSLDEMRAAQRFLRSSIGQALPLDSSEDDSESSGFFVGSAQRLEFVATLPGELGGGIQLHTLALHGTDLQIAFAQVQSSADGTVAKPWGDPQVLVHDVAELQLSYRGVSPKGEATGWISNWPWPTRLPRAVRIDAKVNGPVPWLAEVVALRLDLSGGAGGQ
ncbi:prepilin-type N-terminal cleavage/methylation domain-containing protein [Pseudomonas sp. DSP3-2-2]|uniref:prepilin-type N-terminal cleavage/methylation domain-containing protein n=1 Tax=unclassified Pseudomonas TaxID=196821 RepID=UPI003CF23133